MRLKVPTNPAQLLSLKGDPRQRRGAKDTKTDANE